MFAVLISACIIAQLTGGSTQLGEGNGRFSEKLQLHEHRMTSPVEPSNKMNLAATLREWLPALAVSLGTALLVVAPFFWLGSASGHDFGFHAASWLDASGQWREGIVFPRWAELANHGFGEPRFIFYPPLSWMLGAGLSFVAPWRAVPGVYIVMVQTIAGLCLFALARRVLTVRAALFGAACYAANPYALVVVYMRSDFAEQLGCALMPLVVVTALQLCGLVENRQRSQARAMAFFAVAFASVWLSNAPAGVMASYSAALIFTYAALQEKSWGTLRRGGGGLALGLGLAGFYLVPAAFEQRWVNIGQALSTGLQPADNFLYTMIGDPEHNLFNWIASSAAILLMVMTGIAAIAAHRREVQVAETVDARNLWRVLLLLSAATTILMLRPSSFLWVELPKLKFVQFPWRWMAILAVPYAYFLAAAISRRRGRLIWITAVLLVTGGSGTFLVLHGWWDSEDIPVLRQAIASDQGYEGTDEYDPVGDDHYNLPEKAPRVEILPAEATGQHTPEAEVRILRWTAEERDLQVTSGEPLRVALRLMDYPAWRVEVNGKLVTPQRAEGTAQMILPLAPGAQRVTARFVRTPDRTIGIAISVLVLLTLLALLNAGGARLLSASP
jgi:hypothetical protein